MSGRKAFFLDRDGVINVDRRYVHSPETFEWIDGIFETVRTVRSFGLLPIVVTNQAGIARGYYTESEFHSLTEWMCNRFATEGAPITAVYYCPYHPDGTGIYRQDNHPDRKPNPGMLYRAARDHDLDLASSILLGDKDSDAEAGRRAGLSTVALLTNDVASARTDGSVVFTDHNAVVNWLKTRFDSVAVR